MCEGCRALRLSDRRAIYRWRANWRKKAISAAGNSLDEGGILSRVTKSVAHAPYGRVEAVVEVNECISRPQAMAQIVASDDFSRLFQKQRQYLERLLLDLDLDAAPAEFAGVQVKFEDAKATRARRLGSGSVTAPHNSGV